MAAGHTVPVGVNERAPGGRSALAPTLASLRTRPSFHWPLCRTDRANLGERLQIATAARPHRARERLLPRTGRGGVGPAGLPGVVRRFRHVGR